MIVIPMRLKKESEEHGECGTMEKCKDCTINMFMHYAFASSRLYVGEEDKEWALKEAAQIFIDKCCQKDLDKIGEIWGFLQEDMHKVPPRERAGMRRGFDLLLVASMSRY